MTNETQSVETKTPVAPDPLAPLSAKERNVFFYLVDGFSNTEIAARLSRSPRTIETHRERILKKLGCKNAVWLTRFAVRHGLLLP